MLQLPLQKTQCFGIMIVHSPLQETRYKGDGGREDQFGSYFRTSEAMLDPRLT
jgi:hypothetical protein